jgi:predicted CopG family antitoxin
MLQHCDYDIIAMTTTVQISDETRRLLEKLKKETGLRSLDEVIGELARRRTGTPRSLFGACKGSSRFEREREHEHDF